MPAIRWSRQAASAVNRALAHSGVLIVLWAPAVILALWGYGFLRTLVEAVLSPGAPLQLAIATEDGPLRVRAGSFSIAVREGRVFATDVEAWDPAGEDLARIARLDASFPFPGRQSGTDLRLRDVFFRLERVEDGSFAFERWFPSDEPPDTETAFRVETLGLEVRYVDRTGADLVDLTLVMPRLVAEAFADKIVLAARTVVFPTIEGRIDISALQFDGGWDLDIRARSFDVAALIRAVKPMREIAELREAAAEWDVRETNLTGRIRIADGKDGFSLSGRLAGQLRGVTQNGRIEADVADGVWAFDQQALTGSTQITVANGRHRYDGWLRWDPEFAYGGRVSVQAAHGEDLPASLATLVPPEARFAGADLRGEIAGDFGGVAGQLAGTVRQLDWGQERVEALRGRVVLGRAGAQVGLEAGVWDGVEISGYVTTTYDGRVAGRVASGQLDLARLLSRFGPEGEQPDIAGHATAEVVLAGSLAAPTYEVRAQGEVRVEAPELREPITARFEGGFGLADEVIRLDRMRLAAPQGQVTVEGQFPFPTAGEAWTEYLARTRFELIAEGLDLSTVRDGVDAGRLYARLTGDAQGVGGRIEVYDVHRDDVRVALAASPINLVGDQLALDAVRIVGTPGTLDAALTLNLGGRTIEGFVVSSPMAVEQLAADWVGDVWLERAQISGTWDDPMVQGLIGLRGVAYASWILEEGTAPFRYHEGILTLAGARGSVAEGRVGVSGRYTVADQEFLGEVYLESLNLRRLLPGPIAVDAAGLLMGRLDVAYRGNEENGLRLIGIGDVQAARLGGTVMDAASWRVAYGGESWTGDVNLRQGDATALARVEALDPGTREIVARVEADGFELEPLLAAVRPMVDLAQAKDLNGRLVMEAHLRGTLDRATVIVPELAVEAMTYRNRPIGRMVGSGARDAEGRWSIPGLVWTRDANTATDASELLPGRIFLTGSVQEKGLIELDGEINNLDVEWLSRVVAEFPNLRGIADLSFVAMGTTSDPEVRASLRTENLAIRAGEEEPYTNFGLNISTIRVRDRALEMEDGQFVFQGIRGTLERLTVGLDDLAIGATGPLFVRATLPRQDLDETVRALSGWEDVQNADVEGELVVRRELGQWDIDGRVVARADRLRSTDPPVDLGRLEANVTLRRAPGDAQLQSETRITSGEGTFRGDVLVRMATSFQELLETIADDARQWTTLAVQGGVFARGTEIAFNDRRYGAVASVVDTDLTISGRAANPRISGGVFVRNAFLRAPDELPAGGDVPVYAINPTFDIEFDSFGPIGFRSAGADVRLEGGGTLKGRLSAPLVEADFYVLGGVVQLPTSRLTLTPNEGEVFVYYNGDPASGEARLLVRDVTAVTYLTAPYGEDVERFRVVLEVNGDLLSSDDWTRFVVVTSDPSGLDREQVVALLGQSDFFTRIQGRVDRQVLGEAITRFALPAVLDNFTAGLAKNLGLDYLSIDYNSLHGTSATAAKTIGNGLVLQMRRQMSDPTDGSPRRFDLRLSYRLPVRSRILDRLTLSVGTDHLRPWKVALQYSKRF